MTTVCLEGVANSHGPDLLHAPPGMDPIIDNGDFGD
jgi:hypothetical protein